MDFEIGERLYVVQFEQDIGLFGPLQVRVVRKSNNGHIVVMDRCGEIFKVHVTDVYKSIQDANSASAAF